MSKKEVVAAVQTTTGTTKLNQVVVPTPAAPTVQQVNQDGFSPEDEKVLEQVGQLNAKGSLQFLESRHAIGNVLHTAYYTDRKRQQRGAEVMKEIERRHDIAISDLYRAIKFFTLRADFAAFQIEFPQANTWSAVKALLPTLEGGDKPGKKPVRRKKESAQVLVEQLLADLDKARNKLASRRIPSTPDDDEPEVENAFS
jgi:hypothetical protein